jgi:hypothetical protein
MDAKARDKPPQDKALAAEKPAGPPRPEPRPASPAGKGSGAAMPREIGGPPGPEPTRYGDWQFNGRVTDF